MEGFPYDIKLVTPALLFSKVLIFNWRGAPQPDMMIEMLGVLAAAAEAIELGGDDDSTSDGSGGATAGGGEGERLKENIFGCLHIVYR